MALNKLQFTNGDQYVNYEGKKLFIYGSIHTHQLLSSQGKVLSSNSYILSGYDGATSGDIQFAQHATIGKPIFAIGTDNSLHGYVYGDIEYKEIGANRVRNTLRMKFYNGYWNGHTKKELEKGSFKLIPQLKKLLSKH